MNQDGLPLPDLLAVELYHLYSLGVPLHIHYQISGGDMPYRLNPKDSLEVQVFKGKKWKKLKRHPTADKARKHLAALKINVKS